MANPQRLRGGIAEADLAEAAWDEPQPRTKANAVRWVGRLAILCCIVVMAAFGLMILTSGEDIIVTHSSPKDANQQSGRLSMPRLVAQGGRAYVNEPLLLAISLDGASGREFLTLTGLEAETRLSAGKVAGPNSWRLSAFDLGNVFAYAPQGYVGAMNAVVDLYSANEIRLASQTMRLEWAALNFSERAGVQIEAEQTVVSQPPAPPRVAPKQSPLSEAEVADFVQRGLRLLKIGDLSAARIAFRRAAEAGNAQAAFLLGSTFDPLVLRAAGVVGFPADVVQARAWYEKAIALGSVDAKNNIDRLAQVRKQ